MRRSDLFIEEQKVIISDSRSSACSLYKVGMIRKDLDEMKITTRVALLSVKMILVLQFTSFARRLGADTQSTPGYGAPSLCQAPWQMCPELAT